MAQNMKRGRNQRRRSGPNVNRALDSNGPDVKIRGTAVQIYDKYQALARDAASSGDRIRAESLLQHAEHYYRVMKAMQPPQQSQNSDPAEEPQPSVETEEKDEEEKPKPRGRGRDKAAKEAQTKSDEPVEASESDVPETEASDGEEEKPRKPRRKRAPRKTVSEGDEKVSEVAAE